ncbi:unnamed protein product [Trichobilharzia regenti]|nr:unnamed protein product [Trichobilharzia regenti]
MFNNSRNRESYYNYSGNELLTTYFHNIQHSNDDDYHDNHRNIFKYSYQNARHQQPTTSTELPSPASLSSSSSSLSPPAAELPLHPVNLPQKRVVANLRERRRMRLINRAFSGLRSRLPEELFYSSTTLFNPTCDSVVYNNQNPIVIRKDNEVTNRWSQRNTNPVHSYLRKLSISKVDILRAAINYIHLLQKMLNEVDCNHSAQGYSDNFNQFNAVELKAMNSGDASQSSSSSFYNIDESVGQQLHSNLVSLTVIRTSKLHRKSK